MEFNIGPFALRTRIDPKTGDPSYCDLYSGDGTPKELTLDQGRIGQEKVLM